MNDPDLYNAAKALCDFPGLPFEGISQLSAYQFYEREKHAEHLVELAADFVSALDAVGGGEKLRRQFVRFRNYTDPNSRYRQFLKAAHNRIVQAWQASPDKDAESLKVSELTVLDRPERFAELAVARRDVERFLGFGESVLWHPYELKTHCARLLEYLGYEELTLLWNDLRNIIELMEAEHLWGSVLLDVAHDVTRSPEPNAHLHRNLMMTIAHAQGAVAAIKDAAEDLFVALHVDSEELKPEQRSFLVAMLKLKAFSIHERSSSDEIVKEALGSGKTATYGEMLSDLVHRGLAMSKEGAGGGRWLTGPGRSVAGKLRGEGVRTAGDETAAGTPASGDQARTEGAASMAPARPGGSSPVPKEAHRQPGSKVLAAESSQKKDVGGQPRDAGTLVAEFLKGKPGAKREQIAAQVLLTAPYLSTSAVDDAIDDRIRVEKKRLPDGGWGFFNKLGRTDANSKL